MIKAIFGIISNVLGIFRWFQDSAEREQYKQAGRTEAENEQRREAMEAKERMDSVPTPDSNVVRKRLHTGDF